MTRRAVGLLLLAAVCRAQHVQFGSLVNGTPVANPAMDSQGNLIQLTINPITGICCGMGSRLALLVNRYGRDGSARILADTGLTPAEAPVFLAVDARDKAYVGANREGEPILLRIKPDGTREQRMLFVPFTRLAAMAFASDGDPVIVGSDFGPTIQVVRLDADTLAPVAAKLLNRGVGVPRAIAVDTAGNVYITGVSTGFEFDATPGALQPVGSGVFVTKLSPDLQSVVYSTHIADKGVSGGMAIQAASDGTVYVAGYVLGGAGEGAFPTTPGAFQRQLDREPRLWLTNGGLPLVVGPSTGFVLRLNSEGSALIASTLLGGSLSESIDGLALDEQGRVIVHGSAQSRDFPATGVFSTPCGPDRGRAFRAWFLTRLDPMLERVERSILVSGVVSRGLPSGSLRGSVFLILSGSRALADLDRDEPSDVACVTSGASYEGLSALTPGQLVTVIGRGLGPAQLAAFEDGKPLPDTVDGAEVLFNGVRAPILAAVSSQLNVVAPLALDGNIWMEVKRNGERVYLRHLRFAVNNPDPLLRVTGDGVATSSPESPFALLADAVNEDGSRNGTENPAAPGSLVTVFATGLGALDGPLHESGYGDGVTRPVQSYIVRHLIVGTTFETIEAVESVTAPGRTVAVHAVRFRIPLTARRLLHFTVEPSYTAGFFSPANFIYTGKE